MSENVYEPQELLDSINTHRSERRLEQQIETMIADAIEQRKEWFSVTLERYDASAGGYVVKKPNGSTVCVQAKSMPGGVGTGSRLVLYYPRHGIPSLFLPL